MLAAYPVMQAALVIVLATAAMISPTASPALLGASAVASGICAASVITAFTAAGSLRRRQRARREGEELERALAKAMAGSQDELAFGAQLMKVHHDLRNHLHAIAALAKAEDAHRAVAYARRLALRWRVGRVSAPSEGEPRR